MPTRHLIFILGMHRSGTSALVRAMHLQGATLPKTLMPAQADNPEGFFESLPVVQLNNRLLHEAGRAWDDPRPIDAAWWRQPGKRLHRIDQARQVLEREFPEGELLVLKDPRLSRLLPIWLAAAEQVRLTASALICCRNPLEVAASLAERNGMDGQRAHLLWLAHLLDAEYATRKRSRAFVHYGHLLTDWRDALSHAYDALGLDSLALTGEVAEAIDACLAPTKRHHCANVEQVLQNEQLNPLLKQTWTTLLTRPPLPAEKTFDPLRERLADAWAILGPSGTQSPAAPIHTAPMTTESTRASIDGKTAANPPHRHVILHYHLFKNAGTSLDHILKANFKDGWNEHEGLRPGWRSQDIVDYLRQHPEIVVLSSHTALLPPPVLPNTTMYPIIFIRHPIDRIRSIYEFERKQIADTEGARMAKETDMAGYIHWRLNRKGDRSIRNFQAYRLAFAAPAELNGKKLTEEERAMKALESLPFVGVVERFDESLAKLQDWLKPAFPWIEFNPTKANVTQRGEIPLEERVNALMTVIGESIYSDLLAANNLDFKIYNLLDHQ